VDHGKTTLVDHMLRQAGTWAAHEVVQDRVMDSLDLERERGITILSKCTSVTWKGTRINIVDTPGHADFGGEVERILSMVDAALLLVDASEGPLPQTRFVLQKALASGLTIVVVINKIDRPDARIGEVVQEVYDLFIDLGAGDQQIEFPLLYACAKAGTCGPTPEDQRDLTPLFEAVLAHTPPPSGDSGAPLQFLATQLDHDPYVGRLAIGRIRNGTIHERDDVGLVAADGVVQPVRVNLLFHHDGLKRVQVQEALAGEIVAIAGIAALSIGDSLTDLEHPRPLPRVRVDEPTIGITFTHNDSPLSGRDGKYVTSRKIRERLEKEALHNVAIRLEDTDDTAAVRIYGRGELQLCILVEQMRRESYEMCMSKPEVRLRDVGGRVQEPYEIAVLDFPEDFMGVVTQKMAYRKGRMEEMKREGGGRVRLTYRIPARGLIGFRGEYLNDTRGMGLLHTLFDGWDEQAGYICYRVSGALVADRPGSATTYALFHLQPRGRLFVAAGAECYEGMVVGENARGNDMNVNICREKHLTNIRTTAADEKLILTPPVVHTLESALEFIAEDELVEVTPAVVRLRKRVLAANMRSIVRGPRREEEPAS
jgi:GTP-binding protein